MAGFGSRSVSRQSPCLSLDARYARSIVWRLTFWALGWQDSLRSPAGWHYLDFSCEAFGCSKFGYPIPDLSRPRSLHIHFLTDCCRVELQVLNRCLARPVPIRSGRRRWRRKTLESWDEQFVNWDESLTVWLVWQFDPSFAPRELSHFAGTC